MLHGSLRPCDLLRRGTRTGTRCGTWLRGSRCAAARAGCLMAEQKGIPENRKLPKKEQDLFRSIVKFYETKQYKKVCASSHLRALSLLCAGFRVAGGVAPVRSPCA